MWLADLWPRMDLDVIDARDPRALTLWRDLEACSRPSYFLSPAWVSTWLASLPDDAAPQLAITRDHSAACWIGRRDVRRHGLFASRAMYLNATGHDRYDEVCIEHNKILGNSAALVASLPADWDELFLPACRRSLGAGSRRAARLSRAHRSRVGRAVCRSRCGARVGGRLPRAARLQHAQSAAPVTPRSRRSRRSRSRTTKRPRSTSTASCCACTRRRGQSRGQHGAFADPWFERFHRRLITSRIASGEIQLVRVRAGETTIGCLYNFVYNGRVLFYQSGLARLDDRAHQAGLPLSRRRRRIQRERRPPHLRSARRHDALQAEPRDRLERLLWLRVQRPRLRFAVEDQLRVVEARARTGPPRAQASVIPTGRWSLHGCFSPMNASLTSGTSAAETST